MGISQIIQLISIVIPLVLNLEQLILGAKQGAIKKDLAVGVLNKAADLAVGAGAKSSDVDAARQLVPQAVDAAVQILNDAGLFKHSDQAA